MTTTRSAQTATLPDGRATQSVEQQHEFSGAAVAAGVLMIMSGCFHAIQGVVALANDEFYVATKDYVFKFDLTTWGWVQLIAGTLVAVAGVALFSAALWARTVAVTLACFSILVSFAWMPFYPVWNIIVIAFDVFVIWAVTAHGRDIHAG
jgi:hypothetical protein